MFVPSLGGAHRGPAGVEAATLPAVFAPVHLKMVPVHLEMVPAHLEMVPARLEMVLHRLKIILARLEIVPSHLEMGPVLEMVPVCPLSGSALSSGPGQLLEPGAEGGTGLEADGLFQPSCAKQSELDPECGRERAAFVDPPPLLQPPPVDFTVNRASPLVTAGQCVFLPLFQPRPVQAARRLL